MRSPEISKISFEHLPDNVTILNIKHELFSARVCLHGGHVLSWQPRGQEDVFWLSDTSKYGGNSAIRGGIPICWPWFGERKGDRNHGFARNSLWQLDECASSTEGVEVVLTLTGVAEMPTWQHEYKLTQRLFFGSHFKQSLIIGNASEKPFEFCGALHSYFNVSDTSEVIVPQLTSVPYDDKIEQLTDCISDEAVTGVGPIDRVYHSNETMTIIDQTWRRMINIESNLCAQRVYWNPGQAVASVMPDIHEGGEKRFVCFEVANTIYMTIEPGRSHTMQQIITLA